MKTWAKVIVNKLLIKLKKNIRCKNNLNLRSQEALYSKDIMQSIKEFRKQSKLMSKNVKN